MQVNKRYFVAISMVSLMAIAMLLMPTPVSMAQTIGTPTNPYTQYPWPMASHDPQGTSYTSASGPKTNHLLWSRNLGAELENVVVWKGKVHTTAYSGVHWAVDALTGETIWSVRPQMPEGWMHGSFGSGCAILQPFDVYVGVVQYTDLLITGLGSTIFAPANLNYDGIFALTEDTGETVWRTFTTGSWRPHFITYSDFTPFTGRAHIVLTGGYNNSGVGLVSIKQDGTIDWVSKGLEASTCACQRPAVFPWRDGTGFFACGGPGHGNPTYNAVVNCTSGKIVWSKPMNATNCDAVSFKDGKLYFGITDYVAPDAPRYPPGTALPGTLFAFDAYSGQQLWTWTHEAVGLPTATPSACLALAYDRIYFGDYAGNMFCLDEKTQNVIWYRENVGAMAGRNNGPIVADGIVYGGGAPWRVYGAATSIAFNATTGETIWTYSTPAAQKHQGAVADGIWYVPTANGWLYAFGDGPTKTTVDLSSKQLKAGDTVLISGQVLDQSPASPNAPVANAPVTLMYAPLGSVNIATIATVTTSYSGDYYYEWTVPNDLIGMNSIVVSFAGIPGYKASSSTTNFRSGSAGLTQTEINQIVAAVPQPVIPTPTDYTPMFYAVLAVAAIAVVVSVYAVLLIKKLKK